MILFLFVTIAVIYMSYRGYKIGVKEAKNKFEHSLQAKIDSSEILQEAFEIHAKEDAEKQRIEEEKRRKELEEAEALKDDPGEFIGSNIDITIKDVGDCTADDPDATDGRIWKRFAPNTDGMENDIDGT